MRGQQGVYVVVVFALRIIPARAGPTFCRCGKSILYPDHPRSCGANHGLTMNCVKHFGSSPLVRGQPRLAPARTVRTRIIPARAGPTVLCRNDAVSAEDHPRSCGANVRSSVVVYTSVGSSPLVRGQPACLCALGMSHRIIPARAGPTRTVFLLP